MPNVLVSSLFLFLQILNVDAGPVPKLTASFASETVQDSAIVKTMSDFETFAAGEFYFYNRVDLNGDRNPEVLLYVTGREVCGSGGCPLFVLKKVNHGYNVISEISLAQIPVVVSSSRTNGWNNLILRQRSYAWDPKNKIGHPSYYAELPFDGRSYPDNPTVKPARPLGETTAGVAYMVNPDSPEFGIRIQHKQSGKSGSR